MPQVTRYGFLGPVDWAVVEACDVTAGGGIVLTSGGRRRAHLLQSGRARDLIELNRHHPPPLLGHARYLRARRSAVPPADPDLHALATASARRSSPSTRRRSPASWRPTWRTKRAASARSARSPKRSATMSPSFWRANSPPGMIPKAFLPIQSGVGDIANSVLGALGSHPGYPAVRDVHGGAAGFRGRPAGARARHASPAVARFTVTPPALKRVYDNLNWFRSRIVLRPQEISNNPEVIRRLGIISINTAIEVDIFGNVNSTHVMGRKLMNGIGGSGDFTRNAYLSIFTCPSTAKGGKISTIVPLVTHVDHSEHSVQIIATEHGVADLRGKSPFERANEIIDNCAHPEFRDLLHSYLTIVEGGHTPHTLSAAFRMHEQFQQTGDMRGCSWDLAHATASA